MAKFVVKPNTMSRNLSAKEIGQRIVELRKRKGLSQEELAKRLKISRSSMTQMELGNRSMDVLELQQLALVLEFSLDNFMSANPFQAAVPFQEKASAKPVEERIAVPTLHVEKFKNMLLYVLERCAGKPNVGETVLNKLLYFIDFNYYELYEEHLSGAIYRKLQFGPVPQHLDQIMEQLIKNQQIQRVKTEYHGYPQSRYLPLVKPNLQELKASEKEVIDRVIEQMSDWSATAISDYSHKDLPWEATEEGKVISYELAFYRDLPYSVRVYDEDAN